MKTLLLHLMALILVLPGFGARDVLGDTTAGKSGDLTIPWDEFKGLLNLDKDQIVIPLETFQKLLLQTGAPVPPHNVQGGMIIMTQDEFSNLVSKMKPPTALTDPPPFDYLITKAHYNGVMRDAGTSFTGTFVVHVLKRNSFVKVPVLPISMALENVTVNGKQSLVVAENGNHHVIISGADEYDVTVTFSVMSRLEDGPGQIELAIVPTPITLLTLTIPSTGLTFEIPQGHKVASSNDARSTKISAVIAQGRNISIQWRRALEPTEKLSAKVYGESHYLVSIEEDALSVDVDINLQILHSEITDLQLVVPDGVSVLSIAGPNLGEWSEIQVGGERRLVIPFTYGIKGNALIQVRAEAALTESGLANAVSGFQVAGITRETGSIGIELNTSAEVLVVTCVGLEPIAVQKLPAELINKSSKPLMFGFRLTKSPFELVLDIKKHEKIAVPVATITSASAVSLFTEDGKIVHRLVYQVRNNSKQFLEFQLPDSADVWSVFVSDQPVEASMNDDARLMVPLIRSQAAANGLESFPVEIVYCVVDDGFSWSGNRGSMLPAVDLLISQLIWSVYLPSDYSYLHFSSTLEIEEMIRGIGYLSRDTRTYDAEAMRQLAELGPESDIPIDEDQIKELYDGKNYKSEFRNVPLEAPQVAGQLNAEMEFGGRMEALEKRSAVIGSGKAVGVLPIQIRIPTGGQVYRFARTIIRPDDVLSMSVTYGRNWVVSAVQWILAGFLLLLILANRKRFIGPLQRAGRWLVSLRNYVSGHRKAIAAQFRSPMAIVVLLGCLALTWLISPVASLPIWLLLWISVASQLLEYWRNRVAHKNAVSSAIKEQNA